MLKVIPKDYFDTAKGTLKLLHEREWRSMGITQVRKTRFGATRGWGRDRKMERLANTVPQSLGWEHYEVHEPEPHILLFKYVYGARSRRGHRLTKNTQATTQLPASSGLDCRMKKATITRSRLRF